MPSSYRVDIDFNGVDIPDVDVHWGLSGAISRPPRSATPSRADSPAHGFSIDMTSVLAMVEAVENGHGTLADLRDNLLDIVKAIVPEGCCPDCADLADTYRQTLAEFEQAKVALAERQQTISAESHPFVVTRTAGVHVWNCPAAPQEELNSPASNLREFTHGVYEDNRVVVDAYYNYEIHNGARRMTGDELADWIARQRGAKGGLNYRRCNRCQPALPVPYTSQAADAPGVSDARR